MGCCKTKIVQLTNPGAPVNIYNTNGSLTGNRVVNMAGFNLTFQGGGDFIIDGKLTVTGIIDPTGLQFTGGVQADAGMPNGTIYVTDGSASGFPSGEIIFKDFTGVYARLENAGGDNIYNIDGTLTGPRVVTQAGQPLTFANGLLQAGSTSAGTTLIVDPTNDGRLRYQNGVNTSQLFVNAAEASIQRTTAGGTNSVSSVNNAIELDFTATSDLKVNGVAGTTGDVLTSQGAGLPPVWAPAGGNKLALHTYTANNQIPVDPTNFENVNFPLPGLVDDGILINLGDDTYEFTVAGKFLINATVGHVVSLPAATVSFSEAKLVYRQGAGIYNDYSYSLNYTQRTVDGASILTPSPSHALSAVVNAAIGDRIRVQSRCPGATSAIFENRNLTVTEL